MTVSLAVTLLCTGVAAPVLLAAAYLALLTAFSFSTENVAGDGEPRTRFRILVPAHDEEQGIGRTVESLLALDYPAQLRRLWVVADNCSDATAATATAAGAEVLTRSDAERRGKGYALEWAFERCLGEGWAEAVVVIDADTLASPNLLRAFARRIEAGAEALQAHYGILNEAASWRTRLLRLSFTLFHGVRSMARERWKVSCGLRGNGMAFRTELLRRVPHRAHSIVEDLEYGLDLGQAGVRVGYVGEAQVWGEMPSSAAASRSQRLRWEGGRRKLRRRAWELLRQGVRNRSGLLFDLGVDLLLPPLSTLCLMTFLGTAATAILCWFHQVRPLALGPWLLTSLCLSCYLARGWVLSRSGWRGLLDLAWAPPFIVWKLLHSPLRRGVPRTWVRTARDARPDP